MLCLFEKKGFGQLAEPFKSVELEGLNEDNNHRFPAVVKALWELQEAPGNRLLGYDQNIVRHTLKLNERRADPIRRKYFQRFARTSWKTPRFTNPLLDKERANEQTTIRARSGGYGRLGAGVLRSWRSHGGAGSIPLAQAHRLDT
jgi:hypothetical protein